MIRLMAHAWLQKFKFKIAAGYQLAVTGIFTALAGKLLI